MSLSRRRPPSLPPSPFSPIQSIPTPYPLPYSVPPSLPPSPPSPPSPPRQETPKAEARAAANAKPKFEPSEEAISQLTDMGFPRPKVLKALRAIGSNNTAVAIDWIIVHGDDEPDVEDELQKAIQMSLEGNEEEKKEDAPSNDPREALVDELQDWCMDLVVRAVKFEHGCADILNLLCIHREAAREGILQRLCARVKVVLLPWAVAVQGGRFRTAPAQRGHNANYYGVYPRNTPENHPPTEACMIHSTQHRGCRIQDPGTHGYQWCKTAETRTVRPLGLSRRGFPAKDHAPVPTHQLFMGTSLPLHSAALLWCAPPQCDLFLCPVHTLDSLRCKSKHHLKEGY